MKRIIIIIMLMFAVGFSQTYYADYKTTKTTVDTLSYTYSFEEITIVNNSTTATDTLIYCFSGAFAAAQQIKLTAGQYFTHKFRAFTKYFVYVKGSRAGFNYALFYRNQ